MCDCFYFRGSTDKEDNAEDKLDGLQKQMVSQISSFISKENPAWGLNGIAAAPALYFPHDFIMKT